MTMGSTGPGGQGRVREEKFPLGDPLAETERIRSVYRLYDASERAQRKRDPKNYGVQCMRSERWRAVSQILTARFSDAKVKRVLDVGCGEGDDLARIGDLLPDAELMGIDLVPARVERARLAAPRARVRVAAGDNLPFPDGFVDLAILSTVLSSVLDGRTRRSVASEAFRVIREDGLLLIYDIRLPSPWNPNVRPITKRDLQVLFPAARISTKPITLIPPVARGLCGTWPGIYGPLARLTPLRSHYLSVVTRGGAAAAALNDMGHMDRLRRQ